MSSNGVRRPPATKSHLGRAWQRSRHRSVGPRQMVEFNLGPA